MSMLAGHAARLELKATEDRPYGRGIDDIAPSMPGRVLLTVPENLAALSNVRQSLTWISVERLEDGKENANNQRDSRIIIRLTPVPRGLRKQANGPITLPQSKGQSIPLIAFLAGGNTHRMLSECANGRGDVKYGSIGKDKLHYGLLPKARAEHARPLRRESKLDEDV